ncbi:Calcium-independent phospholipase A2-gamma [Lachnellula willkommii]|uniref:Calcium-independent phospholipase A2-gamma n=1 Tax=Lachnellula willkommii TaxID=215461 RepID=A0A559MGV9_9HELO|nr:Calcium-independent phospholipase A2-gamma [Lachnellula willkommii]
MATSNAQEARPLRLLSLELVILQEIMHRVKMTGHLKEDPLPADYFDMICGTSTGGLIAVLLGRLRLSVPEAMLQYAALAEKVFRDKKTGGNILRDGIFKTTNLEKAIQDVLKSKLGKGGAEARMIEEGSGGFVCAVTTKHIDGEPSLFRSWKAAKTPGPNCKIWEACRATSAAPRFFKTIYITDSGIKKEYFDGGFGYNNPTEVLIKEAIREFDSTKEITCIVSIGTGQPKVSQVNTSSLWQRTFPTDFIEALKKYATSSEVVANRVEGKYRNFPGLVHRLNVQKGLEEVSLDEWKKLGEVKTHTNEYIKSNEVDERIDVIVKALLNRVGPEKTYRISDLGAPSPLSIRPRKRGLHSFPPRLVNRFVDREQPLEDMKKHLKSPVESSTPTVCVLQGMGGCGKSQLALKYCQMTRDNDPAGHVLWVDATSITSARQSIASIVQKLSAAIAITNEEESL